MPLKCLSDYVSGTPPPPPLHQLLCLFRRNVHHLTTPSAEDTRRDPSPGNPAVGLAGETGD